MKPTVLFITEHLTEMFTKVTFLKPVFPVKTDWCDLFLENKTQM